jgi:capsular polysaccharide transport system permease protein
MKYERPPGFQADLQAVRFGKPEVAPRSWVSRVPLPFVAIVVVPTVLAAIYYLLIASPQYVAHAKFVVRSRNVEAQPTFSSLLSGAGLNAGSQTDAFEVQEYMASRDAAAELVKSHQFRAILARPEADFLARFPRPFEGTSFESLYKNFSRFVIVGMDSQTAISTLEVRAFRPQDARDVANALLDDGEALVNRLNERAMADAVTQTTRQLEEAETREAETQVDLTAFRNREKLIDPNRSSEANLELLGKLEGQLASMRAERAGLAASAPDSPQLPVLDRRIAAFDAQLNAERLRSVGEADSLAPKVGEYERLVLERDIAAKSVEAATAALEEARLEARRKQLYLERVVNPDLPDRPEQPKRWLTVLTVLVCSLVAYAIMTLFVAGFREHRQR